MKLLNSIVAYCAIVLGIFLLVQKPFFLVYNLERTRACALSDFVDIYFHGLALDVASAAYIAAVPLLLCLFKALFPKAGIARSLKCYNGVVAFLLAAVTVVDASLYEFWEFKLDATAFMYLGDPKNAFASVSLAYVALRFLMTLLLAALFYPLLGLPFKRVSAGSAGGRRWIAVFVLLLTGGVLFACIRGIEIWPNTPSKAFYGNKTYFNHAALNPVFNVFYTLTKMDSFEGKYDFFDDEAVAREMKTLFPTGGTPKVKLLNTARPNVLLIVLEGFGSLFIEALGGMPEVGRNMSRIVDESVSFDSCYCSSFRTDRGIVSVLSGYLGQPTTSIMRYTKKVHTLPGLPKTLRANGYETTILYGGDMAFFNMSDYFLSAGSDRLVGKDDFPAELCTTKWGVADGDCFDWLYDDIVLQNKTRKPFCTTFLTLSSHTPFDVPYAGLADEKLNAFAYTDSCVGNFMARLKASAAWENLLVVITADHGFNHREIASPDFPFIPFLLTGGAVVGPRRIPTLVSQTDIAATVLGQMGIGHEDFPFSRDVLADTYVYPFAFNTFNDGFNLRDSTGVTIFDNTAGRTVVGGDAERERKGKVILQGLYADLKNR